MQADFKPQKNPGGWAKTIWYDLEKSLYSSGEVAQKMVISDSRHKLAKCAWNETDFLL